MWWTWSIVEPHTRPTRDAADFSRHDRSEAEPKSVSHSGATDPHVCATDAHRHAGSAIGAAHRCPT